MLLCALFVSLYSCSDIDTDSVTSTQLSQWPPSLLEHVWKDRILLRHRLKKEASIFGSFWEDCGDHFSQIWQEWSFQRRASLLRVLLDDVEDWLQQPFSLSDDVHEHTTGENNITHDEPGDATKTYKKPKTFKFGYSSLVAWHAVLQQVIHGCGKSQITITSPPSSRDSLCEGKSQIIIDSTFDTPGICFWTHPLATLPEALFEESLRFVTTSQQKQPRKHHTAADANLPDPSISLPFSGIFYLNVEYSHHPTWFLSRLAMSETGKILLKGRVRSAREKPRQKSFLGEPPTVTSMLYSPSITHIALPQSIDASIESPGDGKTSLVTTPTVRQGSEAKALRGEMIQQTLDEIFSAIVTRNGDIRANHGICTPNQSQGQSQYKDQSQEKRSVGNGFESSDIDTDTDSECSLNNTTKNSLTTTNKKTSLSIESTSAPESTTASAASSRLASTADGASGEDEMEALQKICQAFPTSRARRGSSVSTTPGSSTAPVVGLSVDSSPSSPLLSPSVSAGAGMLSSVRKFDVEPVKVKAQSFVSDRRLLRLVIFHLIVTRVINAYVDEYAEDFAQDN